MINHDLIFNDFEEKIPKSVEKLINNLIVDEKIEHKNIIRNEQSIEDESFEDAAEDGGDEEFDESIGPEEPDFEDGGGEDGGGEDGGDENGFDENDGGGDNSGNSDQGNGVDDVDINKGSSLNAFTQINQKIYHISTLNELYNSINSTIDKYNDIYANWSELNQLKDLASIIDDERNSFVMQQNPENIIKLRLYMKQYEIIVNKLSDLVDKKAQKGQRTS